MKTDRPEIVLIHAAVYGELQRLTLGFEVRSKGLKGPVRLTAVSQPEETQVVLRWVEAANDIGRSIPLLYPSHRAT